MSRPPVLPVDRSSRQQQRLEFVVEWRSSECVIAIYEAKLDPGHAEIEEQILRREIALVHGDCVIPYGFLVRGHRDIGAGRQRHRQYAGPGRDGSARPRRHIEKMMQVLPEAAVHPELGDVGDRRIGGRRTA